MEEDTPGRLMRHSHEDDFKVRGARNISKLEKLESNRKQTKTSRSVTTTGNQNATEGYNKHGSSGFRQISTADDDDDFARRRTDAVADMSEERRSRGTERRSEMIEESSSSEMRSRDKDRRLTDTKLQTHSTRSLSRQDRNVAAAEMAYRTVGLPADLEPGLASRRSTTAVRSRSKSRGGLSGVEDAADIIVEDAMEKAIEAMYGKKRQRASTVHQTKVSSSSEDIEVNRQQARATSNSSKTHASFDYEANRNGSQTVNETTSRDESRKKAVSYVRVEQEDEDDVFDEHLQRPASADGRLTNRRDHAARRRVLATQRLQQATSSRPRYQPAAVTSDYHRRTTTNLLASQRASGYTSELGLMQSPPPAQAHRRHHLSGDDANFSTTLEIRNPRAQQTAVYTSDDSAMQSSSSQHQVPTLTKGMVTKVTHGHHSQPPLRELFATDVRRFDAQTPTSPGPVQFIASPPPRAHPLSPPEDSRRSGLSAVILVGSAESTFQKSAVDDNFLLRRAPGYPGADGAQLWGRSRSGPGRRTPTAINLRAADHRPSSSHAAFSNEPIVITDVDNDYTDTETPMRRARSLFALDKVRRPSSAPHTPIYSSRPDIRMTNGQVLNLYLFNNRSPGHGGTGREAQFETLTRRMTFGDEVDQPLIRTGNKQTQTTQRMTSTPTHRETTHFVTRQRNIEVLPPPRRSKYIQTDLIGQKPEKSTPKRRSRTPSRVTEETVIMKPSIVETRETEMIGDVFADRRQITSPAPDVEIHRSTVRHDRAKDVVTHEEPEEELLETTVVEEKEQRIEMTIREDLEFSLQRSRGTAAAVGSETTNDEGKIEPWWIPDKFEAFVERKRQKVTQTKDYGNKDDHTTRIDREGGELLQIPDEDDNFEEDFTYEPSTDSRNTRNNNMEDVDENVRIPIFLEGRYNSPLNDRTSASSNLTRPKMRTHGEPKLYRRHQQYLNRRGKHYGGLFDDSLKKPMSSNFASASPAKISSANKHRLLTSGDHPELGMEVIDDDHISDDANSETMEQSSSVRQHYVTYHAYSPPFVPVENVAAAYSADNNAGSRSVTRTQGSTSWKPDFSVRMLHEDSDNDDSQAHTGDDDRERFPDSLDHFDSVLTQIEEELPPPPPPLPLSLRNKHTPDQTSEHHYTNSYAVAPVYSSPIKTKWKPSIPEKSWKHSSPLSTTTSRKLYSTEDCPENAASIGYHCNQGVPSFKQLQSSATAADEEQELFQTSGANSNREDFRHELGDHSYMTLSLTEPVSVEGHLRRRQDQQQSEPGSFTYGWTATRDRHPLAKQPGSYQFRHSRWTPEDYETTATAL